ncbi:tumor necrosis factor receptor superfamily member 6-like [Physella acuta]|uniref:tumor necrosis factor receptor superfamily member 6-like n=1 Tax=Physella acuta TaxID=109671 RepID=UPI0027DC3366|nr:tumor necrosis factor receptor superfamily member 6-like [Physella acuta]XP_059165038.1 tumor necrosis factor receptor superfamily member 6-like [Physella acuta]XP_059165040.1 tumor necrosis factor receptor superfamily member 6-like [Physella acuta]XP_059165041.1 tumor necrosis factor receptor superfamily member 6-like [Physella acuta]
MTARARREQRGMQMSRLAGHVVWCLFLLTSAGRLVAEALSPVTNDKGPCHSGEFYQQATGWCQDCPEGTYMEETDHRALSCQPCTTLEPGDVAVVIHACNRTKDTVLGCPHNFYCIGFDPIYDYLPQCTECSSCPFTGVAEPCTQNKDTVCIEQARTANLMAIMPIELQSNTESSETQHLNGASQIKTKWLRIITMFIICICVVGQL